jgi:hypothetical protein
MRRMVGLARVESVTAVAGVAQTPSGLAKSKQKEGERGVSACAR